MTVRATRRRARRAASGGEPVFTSAQLSTYFVGYTSSAELLAGLGEPVDYDGFSPMGLLHRRCSASCWRLDRRRFRGRA